MHRGCVEFILDINKRFPIGQLLELGSYDFNGTARDYLSAAERWVGVDVVAGDGVDIVCQAVDTEFEPKSFDTLLCLSMLEHDPNWKQSLRHNLQWLKPNGYVFLCWGAENNIRHEPEPWALVPALEVVWWAQANGLEVVEHFPEEERYTHDCPGAYYAILRLRK